MKSNRRGTTVVEVVISFAIVSLAVAAGLMAIGASANFINSGATLKHQRSELNMTEAATGVTVKIDGTDVTVNKFVTTNAAGEEIFISYDTT